MENTFYECFYAPKSGVASRSFEYRAKNDEEAKEIAKEEMKRMGSTLYKVTKITSQIILKSID